MCTVKTPKLSTPSATDKPVQRFGNPYLDGLTIGQNKGRNELRVDLATPGVNQGGVAVPKNPFLSGVPNLILSAKSGIQ